MRLQRSLQQLVEGQQRMLAAAGGSAAAVRKVKLVETGEETLLEVGGGLFHALFFISLSQLGSPGALICFVEVGRRLVSSTLWYFYLDQYPVGSATCFVEVGRS